MSRGWAFLPVMALSGMLGGCQTATPASAPAPAPTPAYSMASADATAERLQAMRKKGLTPIPAREVGAYMDGVEHDLISNVLDHGFSVTRVGNSIHLNMEKNVAFAANSTAVGPDAGSALKRLARVAGKYDRLLIDITGHTDQAGTAEANRKVSEERAQSVAQFLIGQGLDGKRFILRGAGSREPIASNKTAAGRAQNRRVEIKLSPFTEAKDKGYRQSFAP